MICDFLDSDGNKIKFDTDIHSFLIIRGFFRVDGRPISTYYATIEGKSVLITKQVFSEITERLRADKVDFKIFQIG